MSLSILAAFYHKERWIEGRSGTLPRDRYEQTLSIGRTVSFKRSLHYNPFDVLMVK